MYVVRLLESKGFVDGYLLLDWGDLKTVLMEVDDGTLFRRKVKDVGRCCCNDGGLATLHTCTCRKGSFEGKR